MSSIQDAAPVPIIIAFSIGVWHFKQLSGPMRGVLTLVFCELLVEGASRLALQLLGGNLFLLPIDSVLEFGLLAWIYRQVLRPSWASRALPVAVGAFTVWGLLIYSQPGKIYQFNTWQRFAESLLVLGLVLLYFYKVIRELVIVHLEREPMFWVSMGLLIYFAGNVFIFISGNYVLQRSEALSTRLWDIHALFYIVLNSLYALALWIAPSNKK